MSVEDQRRWDRGSEKEKGMIGGRRGREGMVDPIFCGEDHPPHNTLLFPFVMPELVFI